MRNNPFINRDYGEFLLKLKSIDIEDEFITFRTEENTELLEWIKNDSFYSRARDKIQDLVRKIRDHYQSQLKGGWASNENILKLINEYGHIDAFLNENYIIYDGFDMYKDLSDSFIEGVFAALALDESQGGRLKYIEDWMVQKIIFNGEADRLIEYSDRYHLTKIIYKPISKAGDTFPELISNFFTVNQDNIKLFYQNNGKENYDFSKKYNNIFRNILTLAGLCVFTAEEIEEISTKILVYLKQKNLIYSFNIKYITFFIRKHAKLIKKTTLRRFLFFAFETKHFRDPKLVTAISDIIEQYHRTIYLTNQQYEILEMASLNNTRPNCKEEHFEFLIHIYRITENKIIKSKITTSILNALNSEFYPDLYYLAAMYDILGTDNEYFQKFIQHAIPNSKQTSFKQLFGGIEDKRYRQINDLINLCFKSQIDLVSDVFGPFRGIDLYYDWLLNMKKFDYTLFNPKWVCEYRTTFYDQEMRKYPIIKKLISEYLQNHRDPQLERNYIEIFYE